MVQAAFNTVALITSVLTLSLFCKGKTDWGGASMSTMKYLCVGGGCIKGREENYPLKMQI